MSSSIAVSPIARPVRRPRLRVVRDHERLMPGSASGVSGRTTGGAGQSRPTAARPARAAGVRLTRRGRLVFTLVVLGGVLLGALLFGARSAATDQPGSPVPTRLIQVQPGDTLWGIASKVADPGQVREKVLQIEELNALPGPALQVGQRIAVPVN